MLLVSPSYRTKTASSFYRGGNSLYIASKSAVSKIRSFVSPVINSLSTQNPFLGLCKEAVMVSLYKKSHGKPLISRGF